MTQILVELIVPRALKPRIFYTLQSSETLSGWTGVAPGAAGDGLVRQHPFSVPTGGRIFFRLNYEPVPMPTATPENAGFFKTYADFGL